MLDDGETVRRALLICRCEVYEIDLTVALGDLDVVQLEYLLLLGLRLADILAVQSQAL